MDTVSLEWDVWHLWLPWRKLTPGVGRTAVEVAECRRALPARPQAVRLPHRTLRPCGARRIPQPVKEVGTRRQTPRTDCAGWRSRAWPGEKAVNGRKSQGKGSKRAALDEVQPQPQVQTRRWETSAWAGAEHRRHAHWLGSGLQTRCTAGVVIHQERNRKSQQ